MKIYTPTQRIGVDLSFASSISKGFLCFHANDTNFNRPETCTWHFPFSISFSHFLVSLLWTASILPNKKKNKRQRRKLSVGFYWFCIYVLIANSSLLFSFFSFSFRLCVLFNLFDVVYSFVGIKSKQCRKDNYRVDWFVSLYCTVYARANKLAHDLILKML